MTGVQTCALPIWEALAWYRRAADKGHVTAQFNLGVMYAQGFGVAQDYASAVEWYRKAAVQGLPAAQNNLGVIYDQGRGVKSDPIEAHKWFNIAASSGYSDARANRENLEKHLTAVQLAQAQEAARQWMQTVQSQPAADRPPLLTGRPRTDR